jgi:DNA-binding beta-propeller fold protein YncE
MQSARLASLAAGLLILSVYPFAASAQLAVSANDGKSQLVEGNAVAMETPIPDSVTILDFSVSPPKVVADIAAPASIVGPPSSVAIAPDLSFALVTAAMKVDPADPKKMAPDNRMSVIDLKANPPAVSSTVETGAGPSGVAINASGTLALVCNRAEGTVSVFTIAGKELTAAGKVALGEAKSGPSAVAFTPDGKMAFVTRDGDSKISVLNIDGNKVEAQKREIIAGIKPYPLDITASGDLAAAGNVGGGSGDADTVSLIDVKANPPRVVDTITVGQTPEHLKISPDGKFIAVTVQNGTNKPKSSPFYNDNSLAVILAIDGKKLSKVTESKIGRWCQGAAWSKDGKMLVVQSATDQEIEAYSFDGKELKPVGTIPIKGRPAGIAAASK